MSVRDYPHAEIDSATDPAEPGLEGGEMSKLINYRTNETIREATAAESEASQAAARIDGGAGIIDVDGVPCYVEVEALAVTVTIQTARPWACTRVRPGEPGGGCEMKVGEKVIYNGYDGTVIEVHAGVLAGMVDVRLDAGVVCVSSLELKK
jgi:hypothetical protein